MRTGSRDRTLNPRFLLPSSSCPPKGQAVFILSCTEEIRDRTPIPIQGHKTRQSPVPLETEGESWARDLSRGLLETAQFLSHPPRGVADRQGWGPVKLSHPGLG